MIWPVDLILLVVLVIAAVAALEVRDLLAAVFILGGYSFIVALLFAELGAIDVSFVEAVLGAGISGALFIVALYCARRRYDKK